MEIIRFSLANMPKKIEGLTLCLGEFDGFHKGHNSLLMEAKKEAKGEIGVLLFSPYISSLLKEDSKYLMSLEEQIAYLNREGIDKAYVMEIDESFLKLDKEDFIDLVLLPLGCELAIVGEDYSFGHRGEGRPSDLAKSIKTCVVPLLKEKEEKISSSLIKREIEEGQIEKANYLLGRPYEVFGPIKEGLHNGSKLGFPTINIHLDKSRLMPKKGVYAGLIYLSGIPHKAVINVGIHPTLGDLPASIIEAHLLDNPSSIYASNAYVSFLSYQREEKKFASIEELIAQLEKDKAWAEDFFRNLK